MMESGAVSGRPSVMASISHPEITPIAGGRVPRTTSTTHHTTASAGAAHSGEEAPLRPGAESAHGGHATILVPSSGSGLGRLGRPATAAGDPRARGPAWRRTEVDKL